MERVRVNAEHLFSALRIQPIGRELPSGLSLRVEDWPNGIPQLQYPGSPEACFFLAVCLRSFLFY
jgi:hypothetical protein